LRVYYDVIFSNPRDGEEDERERNVVKNTRKNTRARRNREGIPREPRRSEGRIESRSFTYQFAKRQNPRQTFAFLATGRLARLTVEGQGQWKRVL